MVAMTISGGSLQQARWMDMKGSSSGGKGGSGEKRRFQRPLKRISPN
jgi:hypothetical protein